MDQIESVISEAVADMSDIPASAPESTSTSTDTTTTTTPETTQQSAGDLHAQAGTEAEDLFAKESGFTPKRKDGSHNRIPYPDAKRIADTRERKVIASIAKELGISKAEAELKLDDVMGGIKERGSKLTKYEERINSVSALEQLALNKPDDYIRLLAQAAPEHYGRFVDFLEGKHQPPQQKGALPDEANDPEPEPDYPVRNERGEIIGYTYSLDGQKKRDAWRDRVYERKLQTTLDDRFKPIDEAVKQQKTEEANAKRQAVLEKQAGERIDRVLERATKLHGWKEHEADILKAFQNGAEDPFDAWYQVVMPKIAADRTRMRQELLTEIRGAAGSTSTSVNTPPVAKPGADESIDDVIRGAIAGLKR